MMESERPPVIFLGDSITAGWTYVGADAWNKHFVGLGAADIGIPGDVTQSVLYRLTHGDLPAGYSPKGVVLSIGTNNLHQGARCVVNGVKAIVSLLLDRSAETKILLNALLPRGSNNAVGRSQRSKIKTIYAQLMRLNGSCGNRVVFVDASAIFRRSDGTARPDLMPDRLHPNAQGYRLWADILDGPLHQLLR
jgi:lysophospholipase L1-like esterase